jgi:hypothetical protein
MLYSRKAVLGSNPNPSARSAANALPPTKQQIRV